MIWLTGLAVVAVVLLIGIYDQNAKKEWRAAESRRLRESGYADPDHIVDEIERLSRG